MGEQIYETQRSHFLGGFPVVSTHNIITFLENFSHSLSSILLTPGSFLDFSGRTDRDNIIRWKYCAVGEPADVGFRLGPELNLLCDCEEAFKLQASVFSLMKNAGRNKIRPRQVLLRLWGNGFSLFLSRKAESIHTLCPDNSVSWFPPWRNTYTSIQGSCPLQDHI